MRGPVSDLTKGLTELDEHRPAYVLAHKMNEGTAREVAAHESVRPVIERSGKKYRANFARKAVRARTNRLRIAAIQVADDESQRLTQRLDDDVVIPNDFENELPRFIEKVCEYGDAYLLRWPAADGQMSADGTVTAVDVFVRDPLTMRAIYDEQHGRRIKFVIDSWCTGDGEDERLRVNLYYDDRVERLVSREKPRQGGSWADDMFEPFDDSDEDEEPNSTITYDHGLPITHGRTERPYGRPVHFDAYGPQNAITKIMATHLSGIDWNGWPYRYQLAEPNTRGADLADWGDGDDRQAPGRPRAGQAPLVRRSSKLSNAPGSMNKLSNVRAVGQLEGSPAGVFLEPLLAYVRVLGETTDTPMNVMDPTGQVESGQSRLARLDDLLSDVERLKSQLAGPIGEICEGALAMLGEPDTKVTVTWAPSAKVSDTEGWLAVKAKQDAGVPERVTLIEAGYLPDQVDEWMQTLDGKLAVLDRIAVVGTALGQASQMMGLPAETASALFGAYVLAVVNGEDPAEVDLPEVLPPAAPPVPPEPPA